jgi:hypothetical protein
MARANNDLVNAKTEHEREAAQIAFLKAEKEHLRKMGVPVARPFGWVLPAALVVLLLISLIVGIGTANDTRELVEADRIQEVETCERGNESRPVQLKNYRNDVEGLDADLDNLRADMDYLRATGLDGSSDLLMAKRAAIQAKEKQIRKKKKAIGGLIGAVEETAIRPGSVRVTCPPLP